MSTEGCYCKEPIEGVREGYVCVRCMDRLDQEAKTNAKVHDYRAVLEALRRGGYPTGEMEEGLSIIEMLQARCARLLSIAQYRLSQSKARANRIKELEKELEKLKVQEDDAYLSGAVAARERDKALEYLAQLKHVRDMAQRVRKLEQDPEPGLFTWNAAHTRAREDLDIALASVALYEQEQKT